MSKSTNVRATILRGMRGPMKALAERCLELGLRMRMTSHNGVMVYPPDKSKRPVTLSLTASDKRAARNARSQLRRAGINV